MLLEPYDPAESALLEVANRSAIWNLWQIPTGKSQWKPLGFWSKALPSTVDNYSPFDI